jgi:dynein heavy chain, axonemal
LATDLDESLKTIIGDSLLSAAYISYLGAFTNEFREKIITKWKKKLVDIKIEYLPTYSLERFLSKPTEIR